MFNDIKSECFLVEIPNKSRIEQVKEEGIDKMAKWNIELELWLTYVLHSLRHRKPCYVHDIMWPEFLVRRTSSRMIWESVNKE
jgi:hypothetical protein